MKIVNQSAELIKHDGDPYQLIESVARTCYKSESRGNSVAFVKGLAKSKHLSTLEHEYVYFKLDSIAYHNFLQQMQPCEFKFINVRQNYVSGSFRAFLELAEPYVDMSSYGLYNNMIIIEMLRQLTEQYPDIFTMDFDDYKLLPSYGEVELMTRDEIINDIRGVGDVMEDEMISALIPHTIRFVTNRGVSHELVRHRPCSYAQESQRYVGYDKEKFGSEITVIKPLIEEGSKDWEEWKYAMEWCETVYMNLRSREVTPQIARGVLPNDCKTEICVTATEEEWQHIVNLRYHGTAGTPHPQIQELIGMAYPILVEESEGRIK